MALFENLRAVLRAKAPSVAALEKAVADAQSALAQATAHAADLQDQRRAMLVASDAERAAHKAALAAADDSEQDARLYLEELEGRLTSARATAAEEDRRAQYDQAKKLAQTTQREILKRYPELARGLATLLRELTEARLAIAAANADLPEGAPPIADPEAVVRDVPSLPERVVGQKAFSQWCTEDGVPIPDDVKVFDRVGGQAKCRLGPPGDAQVVTVNRRRFLTQDVAQYLSGRAGPRLINLRLPGLTALDPPVWQFSTQYGEGPAAVLRVFADLAAMGPEGRQQPVLRRVIADPEQPSSDEPEPEDE